MFRISLRHFRSWSMVAVTVAAILAGCDSARILAVLPSQSRSHLISFSALTTELARRGHQVTVISTFPQEKPLDNYTDITVPFLFEDVENLMTIDDVVDGNFLKSMLLLALMTQRFCTGFLEHPNVQKLIQSQTDHFDLLILETFMTECFLGFAHKFDVPVISLFSQNPPHYLVGIQGGPSPYAYIPEGLTSYGDHMSFTERLVNSVLATTITVGRELLVLPYHNVLMNKYFENLGPMPYVSNILHERLSMLFVNIDGSYLFQRPYMPTTIEIGGMHITKPKKLPKDLQIFLDEAKDGAIFFSFGSNIKIKHMSKTLKETIITVFSKLKHRVLMRWDEPLAGNPPNIKIGKWLPQSDILAHPNVRLFVSHGGALSMQEAAYRGVPVLVIPIFADEGQNGNAALRWGYGLPLKLDNVTVQSLQWAVSAILNQPSFADSAKQVSARFQDNLMSPLEKAVYWTEYVLRHKGAPHLKSAARNLPWYKYFLLDGLALLALGVIFLLMLVYFAGRALVSRTAAVTATDKLSDSSEAAEVEVTNNERDADFIGKKRNKTKVRDILN